MTDKPAHLCLTCNLAEWLSYANGKCWWEPVHIPTAAAWRWGNGESKQPVPEWGWIERNRPITSCETYEAKS